MRPMVDEVVVAKDTFLWKCISIGSCLLLIVSSFGYYFSTSEPKIFLIMAVFFLFPFETYIYSITEPIEYAKADVDGFEYFSTDRKFVKIPWSEISNVCYSTTSENVPSVKVELNYKEIRRPYHGEMSGYSETTIFIQIDSKAKAISEKISSLRNRALEIEA